MKNFYRAIIRSSTNDQIFFFDVKPKQMQKFMEDAKNLENCKSVEILQPLPDGSFITVENFYKKVGFH